MKQNAQAHGAAAAPNSLTEAGTGPLETPNPAPSCSKRSSFNLLWLLTGECRRVSQSCCATSRHWKLVHQTGLVRESQMLVVAGGRRRIEPRNQEIRLYPCVSTGVMR